jgi:hypothetical protein
MNLYPVRQGADTQSISVTTTSAAATITAGYPNLLVVNSGSTLCFVTTATSGATATTAKIPILPGSASVISLVATDASVAAITASGTTTLYVTPCYGI